MVIWKLDYKESWVQKNWCFWTVVLEKTLESPFDCKEIQPVHSKGDQFWVFIGRTDAEAETPVLWPHHMKSWLIGKEPDAGRDWMQEVKGTTEDEMAGGHHQLNAHEFGWTLGVGDGQGGLACCDSWGHKESDMTEQLNWTEHMSISITLVFLLPCLWFVLLSPFYIQGNQSLSSVQFSRWVVSNSLWPHESQHARPSCPSPTPGVHSDSHPSSW